MNNINKGEVSQSVKCESTLPWSYSGNDDVIMGRQPNTPFRFTVAHMNAELPPEYKEFIVNAVNRHGSSRDTEDQRNAAWERIECAKRTLLELIEHWDEHSDGNKIRKIKDVIEEIL